jgi:hypothetical protein
MPAISFDKLPDDARVWVFGANRPLDARESARLLGMMDAFIDDWAAHGVPVVGARELRYDQFLMVGADERATGVSGCSTDSLFHTLGAAEQALGVSLRDAGLVFWRDRDGTVRSATRAEFRAIAAAGEVDGDTVVFDNTAATAGNIREGYWETRLADAWHARAFPIGARA